MSRDHTSSNGFHGGNNHNPQPAMPFRCVVCDSVLNGAQAYILHLQHHRVQGEVQLSSDVHQPDIPVYCLACNSVAHSAEGYYIHYVQQHLRVLGFPDTFGTMPIRCTICNAVSTGESAYARHYRGHLALGEMQQQLPYQNVEALNQNGMPAMPYVDLRNENAVDVDDSEEESYTSSTESTSSDEDDDGSSDSDDGSEAIDPVENGFAGNGSMDSN